MCVCVCFVCVCVFVCVCFFVNLQEKRRLQPNCIESSYKPSIQMLPYRTCKSCTRVQIDLHSASRRLQHICCTAQRASVSLRKFSCTEVLQRPTKNGCNPNCPHQFLLQPLLLQAFMFSPSPLLHHPSLLQPWLSPLPLLWLQVCSLPSARPWSLSFSSNGPFLATSTFCTLH